MNSLTTATMAAAVTMIVGVSANAEMPLKDVYLDGARCYAMYGAIARMVPDGTDVGAHADGVCVVRGVEVYFLDRDDKLVWIQWPKAPGDRAIGFEVHKSQIATTPHRQ